MTDMIGSTKFWIPMAVFQIAFALTIFALTRQYYLHDTGKADAGPTATNLTAPAWPNNNSASNLSLPDSLTSSVSTTQDPVEISHQANEFFTNKQYSQAAELYARLLTFNPRNVDVYNNLGLTLHYLGRSAEALVKLNEGIAIDPTKQRIWLTLGFVNNQLGNIEQARTALGNAAQINTNNEIGQSATKMLASLP
ncbi:MAG: tetratricopeptide repeat protein [Gammaproteobacteria bacterium]|nr:tetratricopeptide repeat protein [Gammaproteobacteria bacterium]